MSPTPVLNLHVELPEVTSPEVIGNDVSHVSGSDFTGSDVIFPRFFLSIVVVQNVGTHPTPPLQWCIKGRLARFDQKTCIFDVFLCTACLPASLTMHVPISEVHARWHFSMCLNSQRFLQFHPKVMLVAYVNSCFIIIRQNFFLITPLVSSNSSWPKWFDYSVKYITSIKASAKYIYGYNFKTLNYTDLRISAFNIEVYYLKIIVWSNSCK